MRDGRDHTFNEHDQGFYNFTQSHYYDVSNIKPEFWHKKHLQLSRLRFNIKLYAWEGMYFDNNGRSQGKVQQMTDEWIDENFDKEDLKLFKEHAIKMNQKFLRIPVGDIIDVKPSMMISQNPTVKYQPETNPVCAYAALASTLHYLKHKAEAKMIM